MRNASNLLAAQNTDTLDYGPDLLRSGLADISWFFPDGFEKIATIDNSYWKEFRGREFSYKFYQSPGPLSVGQKWLLAREELKYGRIYAPNVYLGLRLLRLEAGVPEWVSFKPASFILHKKAPGDIFDLAVVSRHGSALRSLTEYLSELSKSTDIERNAERVVASLCAAHVKARSETTERGEVLLSRYIESVIEASEERPQSQKVAAKFYDLAEDKLFDLLERYRSNSMTFRGLPVVRTHGSAVTENILIGRRTDTPQFYNIEVVGPNVRHYAHPYLDFATLFVDLCSRGFHNFAELIERRLLDDANEEQRLLFKIYKMAESIYWSALSSKPSSLSTLFQTTFELHSPGVILLRIEESGAATRLTEILTRLAEETGVFQLWSKGSFSTSAINVMISSNSSVFDRQLIVEWANEKGLPILELLVVGREGFSSTVKVWPPLSTSHNSAAIILPNVDFDERAIAEIFRNFGKLVGRRPAGNAPLELIN